MATHGSLSRTAETTSNLGLSSPGRQLSAALAMAELSSVPINPAFHAVNSIQGNGNNSTKASGTSTEDQLMFSVAVSAASTVTTTRYGQPLNFVKKMLVFFRSLSFYLLVFSH